MGLPQGVVSLTAWKPPVGGVREVLRATFGAHAYPRHTHDTWRFIVDEGAIRYDLGRREGAARPSMVSILPPHVVHDGRPWTTHGYTKRVVYLELDVIGENLIGPAADRPILPDPRYDTTWRRSTTASRASTTPWRPRSGSTRLPIASGGC